MPRPASKAELLSEIDRERVALNTLLATLLNQAMNEKHPNRPLDKIFAQYASSHEAIVALIRLLSNEELFGAHCHAWTRNNTFGV